MDRFIEKWRLFQEALWPGIETGDDGLLLQLEAGRVAVPDTPSPQVIPHATVTLSNRSMSTRVCKLLKNHSWFYQITCTGKYRNLELTGKSKKKEIASSVIKIIIIPTKLTNSIRQYQAAGWNVCFLILRYWKYIFYITRQIIFFFFNLFAKNYDTYIQDWSTNPMEIILGDIFKNKYI
jgi:hypothetical protein